AYLGLAAFTLALRRRSSHRDTQGHPTGGGVAVISRYTLRLLTIQQFRRALGMVTACEFLRVKGLGSGAAIGWRPGACALDEDFIWGTARFGAGLWVGGNVTPNGLHSIRYLDSNGKLVDQPGAFDVLTGSFRRMSTPAGPPGEPAQVLTCPVCRWSDGQQSRLTALAFPDKDSLPRGKHQAHFVLSGVGSAPTLAGPQLAVPGIDVSAARFRAMPTAGASTLTIDFEITAEGIKSEHIDDWWTNRIEPALRAAGCPNVELACARPSRPGYFIRQFSNVQGNLLPCDFELYCPNPNCELNSGQWAETVPVRMRSGRVPPEEDEWQDVPEFFRASERPDRSLRIPIPAYTVDDQVYHRCPSLVVATVDKFARLAFEPKAGSLFGQVDRYHARWGYYRRGAPPNWGSLPPQFREDAPGLNAATPLHKNVASFSPPELILQDELHLIEGPLGSMVGLYETAVDLLCQSWNAGAATGPKYVASTATVREAGNQVQALFDRRLAQFPPPGLTVDDSFFSVSSETHPLDAVRAGRVYVGICAPGRGAQTPIIRIWGSLLQTVFERQQAGIGPGELDPFWTLVGYFNAIRELAGARALYRQDIPERMGHQAILRGVQRRALASDSERPLELSSRTDSVRLPGLLEQLTVSLQRGEPEDAVQATAMFGTGVDVDRLGLMVVHGQPKTSAAYIQATGRVGRQQGGLIVAFFRASRPRDLDHYEFFTGYHRALYGYVEPITVAPFSPRARERGLGPLMVALARCAGQIGAAPVAIDTRVQQNLAASGVFHCCASTIAAHWNDPSMQLLPALMEQRALQQPLERRPQIDVTRNEAASWLQRWRQLAQRYPGTADLLYQEPTLVRAPTHIVVLGDPHHHYAGLEMAFRNAPQSLRDVEATTRFKG
ncbi:MAG: DISARM system helicase DrmA, partial [Chloroflexota bacterium]|nr:DISARM system helicase DrmA [Chloroflexota bacterium]